MLPSKGKNTAPSGATPPGTNTPPGTIPRPSGSTPVGTNPRQSEKKGGFTPPKTRSAAAADGGIGDPYKAAEEIERKRREARKKTRKQRRDQLGKYIPGYVTETDADDQEDDSEYGEADETVRETNQGFFQGDAPSWASRA